MQGLNDCPASAYDADRKSIPTQPSKHTYNIGMDGVVNLAFAFNISPGGCTGYYYKQYELSVTKNGSAVATSAWLTLNSHQTSPYLTVNTSDVAYYGTYIVTLTSKLTIESAFSPSIVFEIFLTPCQITTSSVPNLSIGIGNKLI